MTLDVFEWQERKRPAIESRQLVHEVVDRREPMLEGSAQHITQPFFRLACEQRNSERGRLFQLRGEFRQHREATANVKATDGNLDSSLTKLARDIDGSCELVGLYPRHHHQSAV